MGTGLSLWLPCGVWSEERLEESGLHPEGEGADLQQAHVPGLGSVHILFIVFPWKREATQSSPRVGPGAGSCGLLGHVPLWLPTPLPTPCHPQVRSPAAPGTPGPSG